MNRTGVRHRLNFDGSLYALWKILTKVYKKTIILSNQKTERKDKCNPRQL